MITLLETESGRLLDVAGRRRCFCGARRSRLSPVVAESRVVGGRRRRITVLVALERRLEKVSVRLDAQCDKLVEVTRRTVTAQMWQEYQPSQS